MFPESGWVTKVIFYLIVMAMAGAMLLGTLAYVDRVRPRPVKPPRKVIVGQNRIIQGAMVAREQGFWCVYDHQGVLKARIPDRSLEEVRR